MQKAIVLLAIIVSSYSVFGQSKANEIPLFKYLQENFDSSVVWNSINAWSPEPHYKIISKNNKGLAFFTYMNPYGHFSARAYPYELAEKFNMLSINYRFSKPDTNRYFLPVIVYYQYQDSLWHSIRKNDLWHLKDDKDEGEGCRISRCDIHDSGENYFFLITKNDIKELSFYDPFFYESCCPGREGRQKIIRIIDSFNKSFSSYLQNIPVATVSSQ